MSAARTAAAKPKRKRRKPRPGCAPAAKRKRKKKAAAASGRARRPDPVRGPAGFARGSGHPGPDPHAHPRAVVARMLPLTRGRWKLFCSLRGHAAAGMRATLTVN